MFHDIWLLVRCFPGFVLPVSEYCFAVWCSAADTHLKLLGRAVSHGRTVEVQYTPRSVAVLFMLFKIRCNPMHPLNGALPGPHVPMLVTRG